MDFEQCCIECLNNDDLVNEFCRLKGIKRPDRRSPIEIQIDQACKYDANKEFVKEFTQFVFEYVWVPMLKIVKRIRHFLGRYNFMKNKFHRHRYKIIGTGHNQNRIEVDLMCKCGKHGAVLVEKRFEKRI